MEPEVQKGRVHPEPSRLPANFEQVVVNNKATHMVFGHIVSFQFDFCYSDALAQNFDGAFASVASFR
ncbi:ribonuclease r [Anopheles sinensis]|uniref:Ribonuclease r n=1 Tax=Anopheles sinensis TaxID=74873 RepID=A0A084VNF4_ANOSI|nr:ribonuclease r [Anopheles sinensis]